VSQILVTGADGYLGRRIAGRLLAATGDRLTLTVRAADAAELAGKREALLRELGEQRTAGRVEVAAADVREPEPFEGVDPGGVTCIVHAAARTAFNVERQVALEVNTQGTAKLADFARRCPKLERLLVLSTLYSAGKRVGTIEEARHPKAGGEESVGPDGEFANYYEWSKSSAEDLLFETAADLPLSVARLATIIADDDSGEIGQYNAFHNTLKLFFYGLLSLMPGDPVTPLYLATADFTSLGVAHLARPEVPGGVYHLAPGRSDVLPLGELIELAFDTFEADPAFRRRRLLRPAFCDVESFRDLVEASKGFSASPMRQALASVSPFAEQMFLPKEFDNSRLRATWPGYTVPPARQLAEAACARLVQTRWGRAATDQQGES
jgi:nucleoside-diphosphate-sugar epimerase